MSDLSVQGGESDQSPAKQVNNDPSHIDQGFIDRKTGKFTPGHMKESEESRKNRLEEEKHEQQSDDQAE